MSCIHCQSSNKTILALSQELEMKDHQLKRLELDLQALNQKYVAEIERVGNIQHEKDMVEHELEDLSRKLFEEANAMVSIEKRARYQAEIELKQTQEYLLQEKTQLHELRSRLLGADEQAEENNMSFVSRDNHSNDNNYNNLLRGEQQQTTVLNGLKRVSENNLAKYQKKRGNNEQQRTLSMPPPPMKKRVQKVTFIDEIQLNAFREYNTMATSNNPSLTKKLNSTVFMKNCLNEDIEPCLRFGSNSKLSMRKMIDNLSRQTCFIEHTGNTPASSIPQVVPQKRGIWDRFPASSNSSSSSSHIPVKSIILSTNCSACGRAADGKLLQLNYRFRLDENDNWLPIDQYCRDRLVAVCDFFVFIRNIKLGLYLDRPIEDLYAENIRLRLQMFYSRMGASNVVNIVDLDIEPDLSSKTSAPCNNNPLMNSNEEEEHLIEREEDDEMTTGPCTPESPHISNHILPVASNWATSMVQ